MIYDMAPMEGITTYIYRTTFAKYYGGITHYYTPFLASMNLSTRERNDILPEHNAGITVIPQILSNKADEFLAISKTLKEYGYDMVNLNLGCPSGTVVSKHRGSGFLAVPQELDLFLSEIFDKCPLKISIKTRLGIQDEAEWETILKIYEKYPLAELIIHTRLQKDFYKLPTRPHLFHAAHKLGIPLCYNGDIDSADALCQVTHTDSFIDRVMLGRGLIADPELVEVLQGNAPRDKERLRQFLDTLCDRYISEMAGGDCNTLYKMKEIWVYLGAHFPDGERYVKKIKKANHLSEYESVVNTLFSMCELK